MSLVNQFVIGYLPVAEHYSTGNLTWCRLAFP